MSMAWMGVVAGVLGHEGQVVIVDVVPGGGQGGVEGVGTASKSAFSGAPSHRICAQRRSGTFAVTD